MSFCSFTQVCQWDSFGFMIRHSCNSIQFTYCIHKYVASCIWINLGLSLLQTHCLIPSSNIWNLNWNATNYYKTTRTHTNNITNLLISALHACREIWRNHHVYLQLVDIWRNLQPIVLPTNYPTYITIPKVCGRLVKFSILCTDFIWRLSRLC